MKKPTKFARLLLLTLLAAFVCSTSYADDPTLTIGSTAPAIDIEHWVSDGQGSFKPVTEFKEGNIYVIEFWATWCGPCIASMPHLCELQNKFADKGVQIISVSDEDLDTVNEFLEQEFDGEEADTYGELTSQYCLTTDPDESVSNDYFRASGQKGIPCAFIVGKTGLIEWIGHPIEMEKPLDAVIGDTWDRDAFTAKLKKQQAMESRMDKVIETLQGGDMENGLEQLDEVLADFDGDDSSALSLHMMRLEVLNAMDADDIPEQFEVIIKLAQKVDDENTPMVLNQIAWGVVEGEQAGNGVSDELLAIALKAAVVAAEKSPEEAAILDTLAHLQFLNDDLDAALKTQKKAVANAGADIQKELEDYLEELLAEKEDE